MSGRHNPRTISFTAARDFQWISRHGTRMTLGQMDRGHLVNLGRFLRRKLRRARCAHDLYFASQVDEQIFPGFSGQECRIGRLEVALAHIAAYRYHIRAQKAHTT